MVVDRRHGQGTTTAAIKTTTTAVAVTSQQQAMATDEGCTKSNKNPIKCFSLKPEEARVPPSLFRL